MIVGDDADWMVLLVAFGSRQRDRATSLLGWLCPIRGPRAKLAAPRDCRGICTHIWRERARFLLVRATASNVRVERLCPPPCSWYQTGRRAGKVRSNDKLGGAAPVLPETAFGRSRQRRWRSAPTTTIFGGGDHFGFDNAALVGC